MIEEKKAHKLVKYVPNYVVFDLETTGINHRLDEIIEISGIKVREGVVVDTFSTLVNPGRPIPYDATEVNGITDEMVMNAPTLCDALGSFLEFIQEDVLVGHNIHSFDLKFLNVAMQDLFGTTLTNDYIDTLHMSKSCLPQLVRHRLIDLAAHFAISTEEAHRALNDCWMNQVCYEKMGKIQEQMVMLVCPKCGGEMVKRSGKFGEFYGCSNYPECRQTKKI